MIRAFEIEIVNKDQPYKMKTYWFSYQHDFMIKLKARSYSAVWENWLSSDFLLVISGRRA